MDVPKDNAKQVPASHAEPHHIRDKAPDPDEDDLDELDGDLDAFCIRQCHVINTSRYARRVFCHQA